MSHERHGGNRLRCPTCGGHLHRVIDSRTGPEDSYIRRRRACESCGEKATTVEQVVVSRGRRLSLPDIPKVPVTLDPCWDALLDITPVAPRKRAA